MFISLYPLPSTKKEKYVTPTWYYITEPDGCHGDETEIESFKKCPVFLPYYKNSGTGSQVEEEKTYG